MYLSRHLLQHVYQWNRSAFCRYSGDIAAKLGYLAHIKEPYVKLKYLKRHSSQYGWRYELENGIAKKAMDLAAKHGHLDVLKWLYENYDTQHPTKLAFDYAAMNGHIDVLRWLLDTYEMKGTEYVICMVARFGRLDVIKWIYKNCKAKEYLPAIDIAVCSGNLELVKWLDNYGHEGTMVAIEYAAGYGYLEILKYLVDECNITECSSNVIQLATKNGHMEVVDWLNNTFTDKSRRDIWKIK